MNFKKYDILNIAFFIILNIINYKIENNYLSIFLVIYAVGCFIYYREKNIVIDPDYYQLELVITYINNIYNFNLRILAIKSDKIFIKKQFVRSSKYNLNLIKLKEVISERYLIRNLDSLNNYYVNHRYSEYKEMLNFYKEFDTFISNCLRKDIFNFVSPDHLILKKGKK